MYRQLSLNKNYICLLLVALIAACAPDPVSKRVDVEFVLPLSTNQKENFIGLIVDYGHENKLNIKGPEARPGKNGDDFIVTLDDGSDFQISAYTIESEGDVLLYCPRIETKYTQSHHEQLRHHTNNIEALLKREYKDIVINMNRPESGNITRCIHSQRKNKLIVSEEKEKLMKSMEIK